MDIVILDGDNKMWTRCDCQWCLRRRHKFTFKNKLRSKLHSRR